MPQAKQAGEFNTFVGGLITEASPLTFPENASIEEDNFVLNRDGSRQRRLGMDKESGLSPYPLSYTMSPVGNLALTTYEWKDVAGIASKSFLVCQVHDNLIIIDRADTALKAASYIKTIFTIPMEARGTIASCASIDGKLVVAYGATTVKIITYTPADNGTPDSFSEEDRSIKIRDLFGVEDIYTEVIDSVTYTRDLLSPEFINYRPQSPGEAHYYNLRNQGWAIPRLGWEGRLLIDTIADFQRREASSDEYASPSNADSPIIALYQNADSSGNKVAERFNNNTAQKIEPPRVRAATGHFIIDLFNRGDSRKTEYDQVTNPSYGTYRKANEGLSGWATTEVIYKTLTVDSLPQDKTEGGVRLLAEFAGRIWYAGFSSEVTDGDSQSPNLSSYLFYSQQVADDSQITKCYQDGDPTDVTAPDRLDTDGGFIRISGAYNIQKLIDIGSGLMVLAENGIWFVGGSDRGSFNANNQSVVKISEHGTLSPGSIVVVDGTIIYWADDAIYNLRPTERGTWETVDLSKAITTYYQDIDDNYKIIAQGVYDEYEKQVRWIYQNTDEEEETKELIFDLELGSFYPATIGNVSTRYVPAIPITTSPYNYVKTDVSVVAGTDEVF